MLDDQLLETFMHGFYGYGNYQAPYWFIGMEEGGEATFEDIAKQLEIWDAWGRKELLDVAKFASAMDKKQMKRLYDDHPSLQKTWRNLIRVFLTAEGRPADNETMRQYQKKSWGTEGGETCVVELMPLPSPGINSWLYKDISRLPYLTSREIYLEHLVNSRIAHLQNKIMRFQPRAVVCYGSKYDNHWKRLTEVDDWKKSPEGINYSENNCTLFISTKHPTRSTNEHFLNIGKLIARSKTI